jgi:RNase H-fold protein (predicted Holliday junction resolvase)
VKVLAVDPGRDKAGVAVCAPGAVLAHRVIRSGELPGLVRDWIAAFGADVIVVGNRTGCVDALRRIEGVPIPIVAIEERGTTLRARARYFDEHRPRGWRRLVPRSLQVPPVAYDDYAAILLAEAYLARHGRG